MMSDDGVQMMQTTAFVLVECFFVGAPRGHVFIQANLPQPRTQRATTIYTKRPSQSPKAFGPSSPSTTFNNISKLQALGTPCAAMLT